MNSNGLHLQRITANESGFTIYKCKYHPIRVVELSEERNHFALEAGIQDRYAHLVRKESRFWNEGGIDVKGSLPGVKIRAESLETIIKGGISFATSPTTGTEETIPQDTVFILHDQPEKAWLEWAADLPVE